MENTNKGNATLHLLSPRSFYRLSKAVVYHLGLVKGFALTDLLDRYQELKDYDLLPEDEWFVYTRADISKRWGVHFQLQRNILSEFKELGFIDYEKRGIIPQKNHFKINFEAIDKMIEEAVESYILACQEEYTNRYK